MTKALSPARRRADEMKAFLPANPCVACLPPVLPGRPRPVTAQAPSPGSLRLAARGELGDVAHAPISICGSVSPAFFGL
jgi:hypothetical protein